MAMDATKTAEGSRLTGHLLALICVAVWGLTFVSTKSLINFGIRPTEIFLLRFAVAYIFILPMAGRRLWANGVKDELLMALAGLSGGSLYFIAENSALGHTYASNVSLIIATTPLLTMVLGHLVCHDRLKPSMTYGALLALGGVAVVVMSGAGEKGFNPTGDLLSLLAALLWAAYCLILKGLSQHYSTTFITRKVFFYGIVSALVIYLAGNPDPDFRLLKEPVVWGNIVFLGIVASMLCYVMWNVAIKSLGAERAANYIYIVPVVAITASRMILGEPFTIALAIGGAAVIAGVAISQR